MPIIRPASELRNNYVAMTALARETQQPIFLTKNGTGDMVLLTMEEYDRHFAMDAIYAALEEGQEALREGRTHTLEEVSKSMLATIESVRNRQVDGAE